MLHSNINLNPPLIMTSADDIGVVINSKFNMLKEVKFDTIQLSAD